MAPELFGLKPVYSCASDGFAFAVVLREIASREQPYVEQSNESEIRQAVKDGERESIPTETPPQFAHLITWCWEHNPAKRPKAIEAMNYIGKHKPAVPAVDNKPLGGIARFQYVGNLESEELQPNNAMVQKNKNMT